MKMKSEIIEEKIVKEVPVYLSKSLWKELYIFQYPCTPMKSVGPEENIVKAKIKPLAQQVELEMSLDTKSVTYDKKKGEQIALNVDGLGNAHSNDNYYDGSCMDKVVWKSSKTSSDCERYAIGVMKDDAFYLTPVSSVMSIKPSFDYLDLAEKRKHNNDSTKDNLPQSDDPDAENATKRITVRFERPETERSRQLKEKSFGFLQKKIQEEPWLDVSFHGLDSERSRFEIAHQFESCPSERSNFPLDHQQYIQQLIPSSNQTSVQPTSSEEASQSSLPLKTRVESLLKNAGVVSFSELVPLVVAVGDESSAATVLQAVQRAAVLVRGNWVVRSDLLYPKDSVHPNCTMSNEALQRARDCVLFLFTKNRTIRRSDVTNLIDVSPGMLTEILSGVGTRCSGDRGVWDFALATDNQFILKYPEVSQRQQMIWQSRYEQLSQHFIGNKHG